jgi:hypothetical protein
MGDVEPDLFSNRYSKRQLMKVTYTAEDGTHFENEEDCLGWERFCKLRKEASETLTDPDDPESWDVDLDSFMRRISAEEESWWGGMAEIWREREQLYRMAALMKQAEMS